MIFTKTPRAPERFKSSSNGLDTACSAATRARSMPEANAEPIIATPISDITVLTSAKSTFTNPGQLMTSAIPATAPYKTLFAALNASNILTSSPRTIISLSLGITINESTCCDSASIPTCAALSLLPSNAKGFVTTATVSMPISLATCATTGAAPVPVPPPIPAVTNSISAPSISSAIRSRSSRAASRPISGFAPAPNPLVISAPNCSSVRA